MNISSIMNSLSTQHMTFTPPPLRQASTTAFQHPRPQPLPLPSLSVAIATISTSPLCIQTKKRKSSSRVARSILGTHNKSKSKNKDRKSRIVFDFTEEEMAKYYHLPQRVAAKRLGVAVITIKRNCKRRGIKWPYRAEKLKEIQEARTKKPRSRSGTQPQPRDPIMSAMTPMMILSEAARAYSRLPIDCMNSNPTTTAETRC